MLARDGNCYAAVANRQDGNYVIGAWLLGGGGFNSETSALNSTNPYTPMPTNVQAAKIVSAPVDSNTILTTNTAEPINNVDTAMRISRANRGRGSVPAKRQAIHV